MALIPLLTLALALQGTTRTIAIDERLAADAGLRLGDRVVVASAPGAAGDTVRIGAITTRTADPSEIARDENGIAGGAGRARDDRSEEHTSELQSPCNIVCRLLHEKKNA